MDGSSQLVPHRFIDIAKAMGIDVQGVSAEKAGEMVIESIKALSKEIGIPSGLKELGVKEEDIRTLAENALKDACGLTNPKQATVEEIMEIYKSAF